MDKLVAFLFGSAILASLAYAALLGVLFVADVTGNYLSLPYLKFAVCFIFGLFLIDHIIKTIPRVIAFNHHMQPAEMRHAGFTMVLLFGLLYFHPNQYAALTNIPWPSPYSVMDILLSTETAVPVAARFTVFFIFLAHGLVGAFCLILGVGITIGNWFGWVDMTSFERPDDYNGPSPYELQQSVWNLEADLVKSKEEIEKIKIERNRVNFDMKTMRTTEQAIRQELVGTATKLSVVQKQLAQTESKLSEQASHIEELKTTIGDYEIVVDDLRSRLQSQKAKPEHQNVKTKSTSGLAELLDKPENE